MKLFMLLVICFVTSIASARIGETAGQSQLRYGQPREDLTAPSDSPLLAHAIEICYEYKGFRVRAAFAGGTCVVIEYAKIPEDGQPKQLSEDEIKAILEAEKGTLKWKEEKIKAPPGVADIAKGIKAALKLNKWERTDGATAEFALGIVLKISAHNLEQWEKRLARDAAKQPKKPGQPAAPKKPGPAVPKF